MSRSTTGSQIGLVRIPTVNRLDFDALMDFAKALRKTLPPQEIEALKKYMASNANFRELARLHQQFIEIKTNFNLLLGLTPEQIQELHFLSKKIRAYKELRKISTPSVLELKECIGYEKRILPLSQIVEWWTQNCEALQKLESWENIGVIIANNGKRNQESNDVTKNKLHQLTDFKNEWIGHQFFAGYSSVQLITFYTDYLVKMETWICEFLNAPETPETKKPALIKDYLNYLLSQLRELKRHAINSMIMRLRCSEFYHDLTHDDLLVFICDQIQQNCGATLIQADRVPSLRKSASPQTASQFVSLIGAYLKANPQEKVIAQNFKILKINATPKTWDELLNDDISVSHAINNTVAVFVENSLPDLLDEISSNPHLISSILEREGPHNRNFALRKLRRLITFTKDELKKLSVKKLDVAQIALEKILNQQLKKYAYLLNDINNKINIELQKSFRTLWDDIFSNQDINPTKLDAFLLKIKNADHFNKKYLDSNYNSHSDIILQLALRLKSLLAKNLDITPIEIKNILKLFAGFAGELKNGELDALKKILAKLPETAQKLNEENEGELLHLLIHFIESSQLSKDKLAYSLARHKHIATVYGEKWDNTFKTNANMTEEQIYTCQICSYIQNVMLKIIQISPYVDFSNFDNNEMGMTLINMENDYRREGKTPLLQKNQLDNLQHEFQKRILFKLNDLFLIKSYLHSNQGKTIDTEKLKHLLDRINLFFTHQEYKAAILESIVKAIRILLKNYCLQVLQNDSEFSQDYIYSLNALFSENLLLKLAKDDELLKTLKTYIETYNGSKNNISLLLVELFPKTDAEFYQTVILPYAKKRLDYIKSSRDVSPDDYIFFTNYATHPSIAQLMADAKKYFTDLIQFAVTSPKQAWSKNIAYIVELLGSDQALHAYRLKRILELLQTPELAQQPQQKIDEIFEILTSSINTSRLSQKKIIPANMLAQDDLTLPQYLDKLISQQEWNYLLEKVIATCGTEQQLQQLHLNLTLYCLDKRINCTATWLGKFLKSNAETYQQIDQFAGKDNSMEINFYSNFFGEANLKKLCGALEQLLVILAKANTDLNAKQLDKEDYKNLSGIIAAVKPFTRLYKVCGTNPALKTVTDNISALENKLCLHYKLNTVLKRQTSLLNISNENTELHNLILTIIDTIRKIENRQIVNEQTINEYLVFFDKEILSKIDTILLQNSAGMSFKVLYHLANLIVYLASDDMKILLMDGNKKNCLGNPHWLHLINHFDQRKALADLQQSVNDPQFANEPKADFKNVLQFATHLTNIKHQTHAAIKRMIFKEADIILQPQQDLSNIGALIQSLKLKDHQCIKLWVSCAEKLQNDKIDTQFRVNYINFLIKFLVKISTEILLKSQNNPSLLTDLIHQFTHIYKIKNRLVDLYKESDKITSPRNPNEPIRQPIDLEKTLQPLFVIIDKALALQLMHRLDKFALKMISPQQLAELRLIYSDKKYADAKPGTHDPNQAALKFALGMTKENDIIKLAAILGVYHLLHNVLTDRHNPAQLTPYIEVLLQESTKNHNLKKSHSYNELLNELRSMSIKYFSLQENRHFLFQGDSKCNFTLSSKQLQ